MIIALMSKVVLKKIVMVLVRFMVIVMKKKELGILIKILVIHLIIPVKLLKTKIQDKKFHIYKIL